MERKRKNPKLKELIWVLLGCLITLAMVWKVGWSQLYQSLLNVNPYFLVGAFFLDIGSVSLRAARWIYLFKEVKPSDACKVYFIGQAVNQILPTGSGELSRAYVSRARLSISMGKTLAYVTIERVADTTFLIAISAAFFVFFVDRGIYWLYLGFASLILAALYALILKSDYFLKILGRIKKIKVPRSILRTLDSFKESVSVVRAQKTLIPPLILLTGVSWVLNGIKLWVILLSFGVNVHPIFVIAVGGASEIIGAFSFLPGGIGAKEVSFTAILTVFNVPTDAGFAAALIARAMAYLILCVIGGLSLSMLAGTIVAIYG